MILSGSCHCQKVKFSVESFTPYPFIYCYCSICRKTAGGGGYAINIMGQAETLSVKGGKYINIYRAKIKKAKGVKTSTARRHFCKCCGSALWISDPDWPDWVYPFASAIDQDLPKPPERYHMMLNYVANWCDIPEGKKEKRFLEYPKESIWNWHKKHGLLDKS